MFFVLVSLEDVNKTFEYTEESAEENLDDLMDYVEEAYDMESMAKKEDQKLQDFH